MKKVIYGALFLATVGIGVLSCEKEEVLPQVQEKAIKSTQKKQMHKQIEFNKSLYSDEIGIQHNKGLDFVFDKLSQFYSENNISSYSESEIMAKAKEYSNEFYSQCYLTSKNANIAINFSNEAFTKGEEYNLQTNTSEESNDVFIINKINSLNISDTQKEIIMEMFHKVDDAESLKEVNVAVTEANQRADYEIQDAEAKNIVFHTSSVLKNSCEYWFYNSEKWNDLFNNNDLPRRGWWSWNSVGKADAAGGIGGAVGGAAVGSLAGGVGAGPGALVGGLGGAIGGSVSDACGQLWDRWFGS